MKKITAGSLVFLTILLLLLGLLWQRRTSGTKQFTSRSVLTPSTTKSSETYPLSLKSILEHDHAWIATLSAQRLRTVLATGDVIPARSVNYKVHQYNNFLWPYEKTADVTKNADITFINLETPLIKGCRPTVEGMIFCGDQRNIEGLLYAGVDVVSLGNNHAGNYGIKGVEETVALLQQNGIQATGVNGHVVIEIRGLRAAFLGYNDIGSWAGVSNAEENKILQEIERARQYADVVIVTYHWGVEYTSQPSNRQRELGHFTIDAGADLVIGNHPHWIQPIEIYKGKLITYAHGNFVFDQMWSQKTREGVVGRYTFYDKNLVDVEYFPLQIDNYGQARFLEGSRKNQILDEMRMESLKLSRNLAL